MRLVSGLMLVSTLLANSLAVPADAGESAVAAPTVARKAARRLPGEVIPVSYDLRLKPNLDAATFSGVESITVNVSHPVSQILLNAIDLNIVHADIRLASASGSTTEEAKSEVLPADEMISFKTGSELPAGDYILHLTYNGKLNDKLVGFYKSTFKDANGKKHNLAATQFEPADARRLLPCFDEPQLKAHFKIAVETQKEYAVISNAPVEKESISTSGNKLTQFAETPKMSSYLLAVLVGDFESTPQVVVQGVPVRVWSVAGKGNLGLYSRDTAAKVLPALISYFGIEYPWKKLDLIAIPDFEAGAMENPGAITFRETLLLLDPQTASSSAQRSAASVIAHEMSHLWFGDLVTMKWWDDLWLNEAFATWSATRAVMTIHPEWEFWKDYSEDREVAQATDALHSTRAIHAPVTCPEQAHEMFDVITYEKGSNVLRMLERYVGEKNFQNGIHKYLSEHSFSNATTEDLWSAIGSVSGAPVRAVMNGWVHQPGYPIITIESAAAKTANGITMRQQRFLLAGADPADKTIWDVPVGIRPLSQAPAKNNQTEATAKLLLDTPEKQFNTAEMPAEITQPFLANAGGVGYYRVRYPEAQAKAIQAQLQLKLDPSERLAYLEDAWSLSRAGEASIEHYLELLSAYKAENDEMVWDSILGQMACLDDFIVDSNRPRFQKLVAEQLASIYKKLGWQPQAGETQQRRILRGHIISELGTIGQDKQVIGKARTLFTHYLKDKNCLDRDLVAAVAKIVAYNGTAADYATFKHLFQTAKTPEEELRSLHMLAEFSAPALVSDTLKMCIDGSVRTQDAPGLLGHLLGRRQTALLTWQYIQKNWSKITSLYAEQMVPRVISPASSFNTQALYEQLKSFTDIHPIPSGESTVKRTLEQVRINVNFRRQSAGALNEWLEKH